MNLVLTGSTSGIGWETLKALIPLYDRVFLPVRNVKKAEKMFQHLFQKEKIVLIPMDLSIMAEVKKGAIQILEQCKEIHLLINNAGILASFLITQVDETNLHQLYGANVFSAYFCAREAVLRMSTANGGTGGAIVNMSSVAARLGGLSGGRAYAGSKGALDSFNLALAKEVGTQGIRVNAIRPGLIETEIHNVHGGVAQMQNMAKTAVPMGRSGTAQEVAKVAMWLAGPDASYVDGSIVDVAGGL